MDLFFFIWIIYVTHAGSNVALIIFNLGHVAFCFVKDICPIFHDMHQPSWLIVLYYMVPNAGSNVALTAYNIVQKLFLNRINVWCNEFHNILSISMCPWSCFYSIIGRGEDTKSSSVAFIHVEFC